MPTDTFLEECQSHEKIESHIRLLLALWQAIMLRNLFRGSKQPIGILFQIAKGDGGIVFGSIRNRLAKRLEQASRN